eukprot:2204790-Pyramimonas_sp.AAC.1
MDQHKDSFMMRKTSLTYPGLISSGDDGHPVTSFFCYECDQAFQTVAGYRGHWTRVHQPKDTA